MNFPAIFKNRTIVTVFKNTFWLTLTEVISRGLKFLLFIYAARMLGSHSYGIFSFALNLVAILSLFSDFGIFTASIREFSKNPDTKKESFYNLLALRMILGILFFLIMVGAAFLKYSDPTLKTVIIIMAGYISLDSFYQYFFSVFRAEQKMHYEAWIRIFNVIVVTVIGLFLLIRYPSVINLSYAYLIGAAITAFCVFYLYTKYFKLIKNKIDFRIWKKFLAISWPLASIAIFYSLYHSLDTVILGFFGLINQVGLYNAAYKVIDMVTLPVILISTSFFPILSKYQSDEEFKTHGKKIFKMNLLWSIAIGLPLCLISFILAPQIISLIYGSGYVDAVPAFLILIVSALIIYLNYPLYNLFIARGQQKIVFWISAGGVLINLILNLILIPKYGYIGAAIATVITYLFDYCLSLYFAKKRLFKNAS